MKSFKEFMNNNKKSKEGLQLKGSESGLTNEQLEAHKRHHQTLSADTKYAIEKYKGSSHWFNEPLRNNQERILPHDFKHLEKATNHPIEHEHIVYRSFGTFPHKELEKMKPGEIYHDKGFTGTTLKRHIAESYSESIFNYENGGVEYHYAKIHIPKGTLGHYIDLHPNDNDQEHEILLHRGTKFKVLGHTDYKKHIHTDPKTKEKAYTNYHVVHLQATGNEPTEP